MQNEFEAKVVVQGIADARARLTRAGAQCVTPERMLRRAVFDFPDRSLDARGAWARVRDEGDRITMSYKSAPPDAAIADCFETEIIIDSFERGVEFLTDLGMVRKSYQETRRETWRTDDAQCDIDTWPGIPTFIEVEAADEATVRRHVEHLGFRWEDAWFGGVAVLYERTLGIPQSAVNQIPEITFAHPPNAH